MAEISIVIVTYNSQDYVYDCLRSIFSQAFKEYEVIVIDNGSGDETVELISINYPGVKIIENRQNRGFSYATNQGIEIAKGKYVLTLNSDVILGGSFLHRLKKAIDNADLKIGMISPKLLWERDKRIIDSTGLILSPMRRFYNRGRGEVDRGQYDERKEIFGPCAAAALYKKEMLEDIKVLNGYFDSDFFLLIEDYDLAWRANKRGWRGLYVPEAVCYHIRNISGMRNKYIQYLCFRNRYFLLLKNESLSGFLRLFFVFLLYDLWRNLYMVIINPSYFLRACYELTILFPKMIKKRRYTYGK